MVYVTHLREAYLLNEPNANSHAIYIFELSPISEVDIIFIKAGQPAEDPLVKRRISKVKEMFQCSTLKLCCAKSSRLCHDLIQTDKTPASASLIKPR